MKFKWLKWPAIAISALSLGYGCDVAHRMSAHDCKREVGSDIYIGEICYLSNEDGMLFRLYDRRSGELLAERTYKNPYPRLFWNASNVVYDSSASEGKGYVDFPPTWLDKLRAKLP
ncbi:hypothetical protein [Trinickia mobilis]|uniref:hypothetical protein n=1 Tax=Trinickia mobilis TaxID=2816356 RepID=UPI001A8F2685|nr:hypothetical protein [Trinickia mobilis]